MDNVAQKAESLHSGTFEKNFWVYKLRLLGDWKHKTMLRHLNYF